MLGVRDPVAPFLELNLLVKIVVFPHEILDHAVDISGLPDFHLRCGKSLTSYGRYTNDWLPTG